MFDDQKLFEDCSSPFLAVWQDAKSIGLHHEIEFMLRQCAVKIANGAMVLKSLNSHPTLTSDCDVVIQDFLALSVREINQSAGLNDVYYVKEPRRFASNLIVPLVELLRQESMAFGKSDAETIMDSEFFKDLQMDWLPLGADGQISIAIYARSWRYPQFLEAMTLYGLHAMCCEYRDIMS